MRQSDANGSSQADELFRKAVQRSDENRQHVRHNASQLRIIHGAYHLAKKHFLDFNPRSEYWYVPESLFLVGYFARFWSMRFLPPQALRGLIHKTFRHLEEARDAGALGSSPANISDYRVGAGWKETRKVLRKALEELPEPPEYQLLQRVMPKSLQGESHRADFLRYLDTLDDAEPLWKESYRTRLAFFPFIGLKSLENLYARQIFFWAYSTLFTSTNSYRVGGAQTFASIIQNNPTAFLFAFVERWMRGESLDNMEMKVNTNSEPVDCHLYMPVVELYGFLTMHVRPIYNQAASSFFFSKFGSDLDPTRSNILKMLKRVEIAERDFLSRNPNITSALAQRFDKILAEPIENAFDLTIMEGVQNERLVAAQPIPEDQQTDRKLQKELQASAALDRLSELERATMMLNLVLDFEVLKEAVQANPEIRLVKTDIKPTSPTAASKPKAEETAKLPLALQQSAAEALAYLRAGKHVLLAGPPGTGKTTLAQFVAYAWNRNLADVPTELLRSAFPITVVANSAWSPFHTIGGILPDGEGRFTAQPGIFIGPPPAKSGVWELRSEAIVLDEMNRADLDRCIGDLYPLLSNTTDRVSPAGIPGVSSIRNSPQFRLVCTVNDSRLSDIVFPISEGLLRRFQRMELKGGTKEQICAMLAEGIAAERNPLLAAAVDVVSDLHSICVERGAVEVSEEGEHLHFGVGYFALLRNWVDGSLQMPSSFCDRPLKSQAKALLQVSMGGIIRSHETSDHFLRDFFTREAA